jgi:acetyltransferase
MKLLAAYGIAVVETRVVDSIDAALAAAQAIGYPVALKILSPDIRHKSDVGGAALDIASADELRTEAALMLARAQRLQPDARVDGFTVQAMVRRPHAHELIVGVASDASFGPVIVFGHGGTAVEVIADRAIALPPLNEALARELVARTRIARLLAGYRDRPAADGAAIRRALVRVSQMVIDLPELAELDINPLLADENGALALDARVRVQAARAGERRLAIRPYPRELEETVRWRDSALLLRPIRPDDEARHRAFLQKLDTEDIRMRIFTVRRSFERTELARLTQPDYEREMAFVAVRNAGAAPETVGVVRAVTDPDNVNADFGIIVRSDLKRQGIGHLLLDKMIRYCAGRGTQCLVGDVFATNAAMLQLARSLGFETTPAADGETLRLQRWLLR